MGEIPDLSLVVMMHPVGKGRPRSTKTGKTFTDAKTLNAEQGVRHAWREAGEIRLGDGPIKVLIIAVYDRPKAHFNAAGEVKERYRTTPPMKAPDLDNIEKMLCDSLNGYAWTDDRQIVQAKITKVWTGQIAQYPFPCMVLHAKRL